MESDELDILMEEWQEYERNRLGNEFKYFINDGFIDKKAWMITSIRKQNLII